jgi:hypothetical protein
VTPTATVTTRIAIEAAVSATVNVTVSEIPSRPLTTKVSFRLVPHESLTEREPPTRVPYAADTGDSLACEQAGRGSTFRMDLLVRSVIRQSAQTSVQIKQLMVTMAAKVCGIRRLREADRSLKRPASKYSSRKAGQVRRPSRRVAATMRTFHPAIVQ